MTPSNNSDEEDEYFEDNGLLYQLMETLGNKHETSSLELKASLSAESSSRKNEHSDQRKKDIKKRVLSHKTSKRMLPMLLGDFDTLHGSSGSILMKDIFGHKPSRKSVKQRHYNDIQLLELGFAEDSSTEELNDEKDESDIPVEEKETLEVDDYFMNLNSSFAKFRSEFASLENPRNSKSISQLRRRKSKSDSRRNVNGGLRRKAINSDTSLPQLTYIRDTTLTSMLTEINRSLSAENTKKKAKLSKSKTFTSISYLTNSSNKISSRAERKRRIPRPDTKRFIDLHIRSVHKKFNRPLPEIKLQTLKKVEVGDVRCGDIIFIVNYHEPNRGTIYRDSMISSSQKSINAISNSRKSKPKPEDNLLRTPEDFFLDNAKSSSKKLVMNIPELESTDAGKYCKPSNIVRARHVMICTNTSPLNSVIEAAHVTSRRARVSTLKPPVSPTEMQLQKRLSFVQMGMNQRGVLPLCYKAMVYRLSGYPSCASEIGITASKFIGTSRIIPRIIDVDHVQTDHGDGFLKKSPRSLFRAPVREEFDNVGRFVNVYSNEFMILSVQRALYQMFKEKTTSFENIRNILDLDPINPWPSVSHSYMHQQKDWTLLGLLDFQFQ